MNDVARYYDLLIENGNDPVLDPPALRAYMDGWDGKPFLDELLDAPCESVLEIGCGTGRMTERIIAETGAYVGIDISPKTVEVAKARFESKTTRFVCDDFCSYPFTETFTLVFSTLTFMHIKDKMSAIKKCFSLLISGGKFVLCIDKNPRKTLNSGYSEIEIYPDDHEETVRLLRVAGFLKITCKKSPRGYILAAYKP